MMRRARPNLRSGSDTLSGTGRPMASSSLVSSTAAGGSAAGSLSYVSTLISTVSTGDSSPVRSERKVSLNESCPLKPGLG